MFPTIPRAARRARWLGKTVRATRAKRGSNLPFTLIRRLQSDGFANKQAMSIAESVVKAAEVYGRQPHTATLSAIKEMRKNFALHKGEMERMAMEDKHRYEMPHLTVLKNQEKLELEVRLSGDRLQWGITTGILLVAAGAALAQALRGWLPA